MYLVVHHRVTDREKFLATDPNDIGGGGPAGSRCTISSLRGTHRRRTASGKPSHSTHSVTTSTRLPEAFARTPTSRSTQAPRWACLGPPQPASRAELERRVLIGDEDEGVAHDAIRPPADTL